MAKEKAMLQRESEIITAISAALGDAPKEIRADNRPHRFHVGSSPDAGWYIAHSFDAVTFGDWRDPPQRKHGSPRPNMRQ